jgi:hypothetical protein
LLGVSRRFGHAFCEVIYGQTTSNFAIATHSQKCQAACRNTMLRVSVVMKRDFYSQPSDICPTGHRAKEGRQRSLSPFKATLPSSRSVSVLSRGVIVATLLIAFVDGRIHIATQYFADSSSSSYSTDK